MEKHITAPITKETAKSLHAGDYVYVTGTIYTARDAAHKRMDEALDRGEELPIDIKNQAIYNRICRTDNRQPYGQICTTAS